MMNAQNLEAFLAILHHRHFLRAADSLAIPQSVISKRLKALEHQLGTELIDRRSKGNIRPTRSGALFEAEARSALEAMRRAESIGRGLARGRMGPLRIGYVFSAAMNGVLTRILKAFHDHLPDLALTPMPGTTPSQLSAIARGEIDLALIRPRASYPPEVRAQVVAREALIVAFAADHRLAAQKVIRAGDLLEERFILPQFHEEVGLADALRDLARAGGGPMPVIVRTDDFISAASLAAAGAGIILAPESLCKLGMDGLAFRAIADHQATLALVLLHRHDMPVDARSVLEPWLLQCGAPAGGPALCA